MSTLRYYGRINGIWGEYRLSKLIHIVQVLSGDGQKIGKISKQWRGIVRESFTDTDMFGINFPMELDAKMKAVLIGACLLIVKILFCKS